jgi:hypothetical protein
VLIFVDEDYDDEGGPINYPRHPVVLSPSAGQ